MKQAYRSANIGVLGENLTAVVSKLSKLPLAYQPGTTFEYSVSTDVLGRVAEVVSGMELDRFIAERITKPLGMRDTGFYVSRRKSPGIGTPGRCSHWQRPPLRELPAPPPGYPRQRHGLDPS